jgi:ubiquinone/menaquinone biosynthesis C-methylase UbiE
MSLGERLSDVWAGLKARMYGGPGASARDRRAQPDRVVKALALIGGERVADIGSGGGYYTFRLAHAVGPTGTVYAVDVDPGLLRRIAREADREGLGNVRTVHAAGAEPALPEPVDLMFVSHSYHHVPDRVAYFRRAARDLRPGGRIAIIEGRREGISRILGHAVDPQTVRAELDSAGYRLLEAYDFPTSSSFQVFGREGGGQPVSEPPRAQSGDHP